MAGIGFELKRLFARKGIAASLRAYGYASAICAGPMLLGILLLLGLMVLCDLFDVPGDHRDLLISMITYTIFASLAISSFFSLVVTRHAADMLYEGNLQSVMPAFWGANTVMLCVGGLLYGGFLAFADIAFMQKMLCLMFFGELIVVWNSMTYLTAIKDYAGVALSFLFSIVVSFVLCFIQFVTGHVTVDALLLSICAGYGVMLCLNVALLQKYFPRGNGGAFGFLRWMDRYKTLAFTGLFMNIGLFSHLVIMWFSAIGKRVQGLFYSAPFYDVPAMLAFITTLITTVNFMVSVEVRFYPHYRNYCAAYTGNGSIRDIMQTKTIMLEVLRTQLFYTAVKQLFATTLSLALCKLVFSLLPLGFDDLMYGYFRTLAVGYGMYAIANTVLLLLLYFTDYSGAVASAALFAVLVAVLTLLSVKLPIVYFGAGFLAAAAIFYVVVVGRMKWYTKRLHYYMLGRQPVVDHAPDGVFSKLGSWLEETAGER